MCSKCQYLHKEVLPLNELTTKNKQCPSSNSNGMDPFITLDYNWQIEQLLNKKSFYEQIITRNKGLYRSSDSRFINDVYDGKVYQEALIQKPINAEYISINLNTDGAPVTNSRNFSIWPLLGTIAELDQQSRENFNNMIVLGILVIKKFN